MSGNREHGFRRGNANGRRPVGKPRLPDHLKCNTLAARVPQWLIDELDAQCDMMSRAAGERIGKGYLVTLALQQYLGCSSPQQAACNQMQRITESEYHQ